MKVFIYVLILCVLVGLVTANADGLEIKEDKIELGGPSQEKSNPDEGIEKRDSADFTIENTGEDDLTDIEIEFVEVVDPDITFTPDEIELLEPGDSVTVNIEAVIPEDLNTFVKDGNDNGVDPLIGYAKVTADDGSSAKVPIYMEAENNLEFRRIRVQINDGSMKSYDDGDDVENIKPGDKVRIEVEVENNYKDRDNIEFEDVEVEVESEDADFDADEKLDFGSISENDEKTERYSFTVDKDIDEDDYDVTFELTGEDDYGSLQGEIWKLTFEVEREDEEIAVERATLSKDVVKCDRGVTLTLTVENIGDDSTDEAAVSIQSEQLGIDMVLSGIELDEGDEYHKMIPMTVGGSVAAGIYAIEIMAFFDEGDLEDMDASDTEFVELEVRDCIGTITCYSCDAGQVIANEYEATACPSGESLSIPVCETPTGAVVQPTGPTWRALTRTDLLYMGVLAFAIIVAIIVVIILVSYLVKR